MTLDVGLVLYLSMSEGNDAIVYDKSKQQNHGAITEAIFLRPYEDMSNDSYDEGGNPIVIADDGQAAIWVVDDFGAGTIASALSDDATEERTGINCLKNLVGAGGFARWGIAETWGADQDWSMKDYLSFWWYGDNSGNGVEIYIEAPNGGNAWWYTLTIDFTGWERIIIPLDRFAISAGAPDATQIRAIRFYSAVNNWSPTFYLDRLIVDTGNWRFGEALDFDGTNDYVNCGNDESINLSSEVISISAWVQIFALGAWQYIVTKSDGANYGYMFLVNNTNGIRWQLPAVSDTTLDSIGTLSADTWYHIVVTYDGAYKRIYINGVLDSSEATTGNMIGGANNLYIGRDPNAVNNIINGLIDEVRIYNRVLSPEEIRTLYELVY